MLRKPAVAGQFYPSNPEELSRQLDEIIPPHQAKKRALGVLCPHAGYPYSGPTAGKVIARTEVPRRIVLLGVNHHGIGSPFAVFPHGEWMTPLGTVPVDEALATKLLATSPHLEDDSSAHQFEHSLEVEVPFLQHEREDFTILPILFASHDLTKLRAVGESLGRVLREENEPILILASSDLNHYEDQATAQRKDQIAIDAILALDPERLLRVCRKENVTMCGVAPTCVMLFAAKELGARGAELIDHRTSGDVTGDYSSVVGYAGMSVHRKE